MTKSASWNSLPPMSLYGDVSHQNHKYFAFRDVLELGSNMKAEAALGKLMKR